MGKRKSDHSLYACNLPMPKWPKSGNIEDWSVVDLEEANMVNALSISPTKGPGQSALRGFCIKTMWMKVSLLAQALNLVRFDDYDIFLDDDLEALNRRQLLLVHAMVACVVQ